MSQQAGDQGVPQYLIANLEGFAFAYGKTAEEFNASAKKCLEKKLLPDELQIHNTEDGAHFVQIFAKAKETSKQPVSLVSTTKEVRLVHETDVDEFNSKVEKNLKDGFYMTIFNQSQLMKPQARLIGKQFCFTVWMVKCDISVIELATNFKKKGGGLVDSRMN